MTYDSDHPLDRMAQDFEAEADDPSCWEPEMFVEAKYKGLFEVEQGETEWEDKDGYTGSFYYTHPNMVFITREIMPDQTDADDKLCLTFNLWSMFVYHTNEKFRSGKVELTVEMINGDSKCIHEFDYCEMKEWNRWPEANEIKIWVAGEINKFLVGFGRVDPVGLDDIRI